MGSPPSQAIRPAFLFHVHTGFICPLRRLHLNLPLPPCPCMPCSSRLPGECAAADWRGPGPGTSTATGASPIHALAAAAGSRRGSGSSSGAGSARCCGCHAPAAALGYSGGRRHAAIVEDQGGVGGHDPPCEPNQLASIHPVNPTAPSIQQVQGPPVAAHSPRQPYIDQSHN